MRAEGCLPLNSPAPVCGGATRIQGCAAAVALDREAPESTWKGASHRSAGTCQGAQVPQHVHHPVTGVWAAHLKSMEERLVPWLSSLRGTGMVKPLGLVTRSPSLWALGVPARCDSCARSLRSIVDRMASAGWTGRSSDAPSGPAQRC